MQDSEIHKLASRIEELSTDLGVVLRLIDEEGKSLGSELPCTIPSLSVALAVNSGTRSTTSNEGIIISVIPIIVRGKRFLLAVFGEVTSDTGYKALSKIPELLVRGI
ncbi:hypothetical protein AT15_03615 [Kosmotoga arenicorallina S304]|uniref:Roadblock/LAMTOR2 domain-containing protein n=1 Tax=Kosmotoga arenicorallina S304 TaxID=1453497 RepID=A0A176K3N0_9BACT|nr:hypothetical protein [Kosmotoga arenicorallina]OAA31925.1 hypothetical protein AT15_03615 [Kosmotoga arenicorallina S304]